MPKNRNEDAISFVIFGEGTSIPLNVKTAKFSFPDFKATNFLGRTLTNLELTVVNSSVKRSVSAKLRIFLPLGATVTKFEFFRPNEEKDGGGIWFPAVAVPKTKAKEVVYKEKEKGRDVAAVSDVASGSNIFEMEVSPLPFEKEAKCRLECIFVGDVKETMEFVQSCFANNSNESCQNATNVVVHGKEEIEKNSKSSLNKIKVGGAAVGKCFGKTHFVCRVPPLMLADPNKKGDANTIRRIAIIWDTSASIAKERGIKQNILQKIETRCQRLTELANKCNENLKSRAEKINFELYTFGVGNAKKLGGDFSDMQELVSTIETLDYDGGTDVTPLTKLFVDLAQRNKTSKEAAIDSVLVFSDGMDNLGRVPPDMLTCGADPFDMNFPVHCIADGKEANLRCLRAIASTSPKFQGKVLTAKDESYVSALLYPSAIIQSIVTDQSEDAFMEEVDDGFRCVPDYRRNVVDEVIGVDGALISGILDGEHSTKSTVSKIVANVVYGREIHEFHFHLRKGNVGDESTLELQKKEENSELQEKVQSSKVMKHYYDAHNVIDEASARLLGHLFANARYGEVEAHGLKSGMDVKEVAEELSLEYGFCSPESSLLMLYGMVQFKENGILPPKNHPLYENPEAAELRKEYELRKANEANKKMNSLGKKEDDKCKQKEVKIKEGEIGGLKTLSQRQNTIRLWKNLMLYFAPPPSRHAFPKKKKGAAARGRFSLEQAVTGVIPESTRRGGCGGGRSAPRRESYRLEGSILSAQEGRGSAGRGGVRNGRIERCRQREYYSEEEEEEEEEEEMDIGAEIDMFGGEDLDEEDDDGVVEREHECEVAPSFRGRRFRHKLDESQISRFEATGSDNPVAPPKDPKEFETLLRKALMNSKSKNDPNVPNEPWESKYFALRDDDANASSPSFFLACARVAKEHKKIPQAIRIASNCLEVNIEDVQLLRCTAYFLLSTGDDEIALELALAIFDHVETLEPCEPQSYLDGAFVRYLRATRYLQQATTRKGTADASKIKKDLSTSQKLICRVLTHQWADRFSEVEWPALILLHYVADLVKRVNDTLPLRGGEALASWPESELDIFQEKKEEHGKVIAKKEGKDESYPLKCPNFDVALMVWMGWDTDKTDIDLHILEPTNNEVYYGNKHSTIGGHLSRDFTQGYGPEVYILREPVVAEAVGKFKIFAKYFASHQDSVLTGTTSAVLWTIERSGNNKHPKIEFHHVRLNTEQEKTEVGMVEMKKRKWVW